MDIIKKLLKFNILKPKIKLITHNGSFHADDIFTAATLSLLLEKEGGNFEIIRTRDPKIIEKGDYVFDVGGIYDAEKNRFDHHQKGGSGKRENGIEYSSFGLVWKKFGLELCDNDLDVWKIIDSKIVSPIDAEDNGLDIIVPKFDGVMPYGGERTFLIFSPTWQEDERRTDDIFLNEVKNTIRIMKREIEVAKADSLGKKIIEEVYQNTEDKRIIILQDSFPRYLYQKTLSKFPEPVYLIYKSNFSDTWKVEAIRKYPETMESRKSFPENWRGFLDNDSGLVKLKEITGVPDVTFCHKNGFLITTESKEGAIKLAELALKN